jgi:hypothetical protein
MEINRTKLTLLLVIGAFLIPIAASNIMPSAAATDSPKGWMWAKWGSSDGFVAGGWILHYANPSFTWDGSIWRADTNQNGRTSFQRQLGLFSVWVGNHVPQDIAGYGTYCLSMYSRSTWQSWWINRYIMLSTIYSYSDGQAGMDGLPMGANPWPFSIPEGYGAP